MKALVSTAGLSREDWLKYRNMGLGGSDAAIVAGASRWKSPVELWQEKTGQLSPSEAGEPALWGQLLEPVVRSEFAKRTGLEVKLVHYIIQSAEYPHMLANVDGICRCPTHGKCIVEIKTASAYKADEWDGNNVPYEYVLQCQHYLSVTGFNGAYIAVLVGGNSYQHKFIPRDEEIISMLVKMEADFWNRVELGIPPDVDGSEACAKYLSNRYPKSVPLSKIKLPDSAADIIQQYNTAREQLERLTEQKQKAENRLKEMLGDNAVGFVGENTVSWSNVSKEGFDSKTFKNEQPTLYSQYTSRTTYRRFTIKAASQNATQKQLRKAG